MGSEFWEVATPFLSLTAKDVTYGDRNRYVTFLAVMVKLGHPITKTDCIRCVSDSLAILKQAHRKEFLVMENDRNYRLKKLSVVWEGVRYEQDTITDAVARAMLEKYPGQSVLFEFIPSVPAAPAPEAEPVKEEFVEPTEFVEPEQEKRSRKKNS